MQKITKLNSLIVLLLLTIPTFHASKCGTFCYKQNSVNGQCHICFNQCQASTQTTFNSCQIIIQGSTNFKALSEDLCKSMCYPDQFGNSKGETITEKDLQKIINPIGNSQTTKQKSIQNQDETKVQFTIEQLDRIQHEKNGWTAPSSKNNVAVYIAWFVAFQLLFIGCFIGIRHYLAKQKALKQYNQALKKQKQLVKKFQKVQQNQQTICSPVTKTQQMQQVPQ